MEKRNIDVKNLDRNRYELDVISYSVPKFSYNTLASSVDENGELQVIEAGTEDILIEKSMFLYWCRKDLETNEYLVLGVDEVNTFLMDLLVNKSLKDISIYSRGLIHYFSQLVIWQCDWDEMHPIESKRPTYRFKRYLENLYRSSDKDEHISKSTAKAYMRAVVSFYKYYLNKGTRFEFPPFEFEYLSINVGADGSNMHGGRKVVVESTDLRLNIPKESAGITPKKLQSLTEFQWECLDQLLRTDKEVLAFRHGRYELCSLPVEFTLIFMLMRHCGLRREEALSFNETVLQEAHSKSEKEYVTIEIGPKQGIDTKNSKAREIELPVPLVAQLHKYSLTNRYIKRRDKYLAENAESQHTPIFLNIRGKKISKGTINARWCEIRNLIKHKLGGDFEHKPHNLRATYAVKRLFSLLDAGMPQSKALTHIQSMLGHDDIETTFHYLRQVEGHKSPEELAEIAIDHLFEVSGMEDL